MAVPSERDAELCPAFAEVEVEVLLEPVAPDLSACTDVLPLAEELACAPPWACIEDLGTTSTLARTTTNIAFIVGPPPNQCGFAAVMDEPGFLHFPLPGI
jgi:hypothetical protein